MRKVITAKSAGFCFGVRRAVDKSLEEAKKEKEGIYTFGPIIHNASVIADLEKKGVYPLPAEIDALPEKSEKAIIIRAHGISPENEKQLKKRFKRVVDATCPFVKKIHGVVSEARKKGERVIICGSPKHPEVLGILGWAGEDAIVISDAEDVKGLSLNKNQPICVVAQTTFRFNKFQELVEILKKKVYSVRAENTICSATDERQTEAAALASQADAVLVLGGENSSNSKKLFEICRDACACTYFLRTADDLDLGLLSSARCVGITAGASTPDYIIEEVQKKCQ